MTRNGTIVLTGRLCVLRADMRVCPGMFVYPARCLGRINRATFLFLVKICVERHRRHAEAYMEAARSITLPPANCAVVSAHLDELRVASSAGMKTIYVRRSSEDLDVEADVFSKLEGGEFDLVVDSFEHLAIVLGCDD